MVDVVSCFAIGFLYLPPVWKVFFEARKVFQIFSFGGGSVRFFFSEIFQAPPSYGSGRYGFGVFGAQDSVPRGRCSVGMRHAFFSITFVSIYAVSWGGQSSVMRSGFPGPKNPKSSATKTTTWHCSNFSFRTPKPWKSKFLYRYRPEGMFRIFFGLILDPPPRYICFYSEKRQIHLYRPFFSPWHGLFRKKGGTGAGIRLYFPCPNRGKITARGKFHPKFRDTSVVAEKTEKQFTPHFCRLVVLKNSSGSSGSAQEKRLRGFHRAEITPPPQQKDC